MRLLLPLTLVLLILAACEPPTLPEDARAIRPPARYHALWRSTEACSGLKRDFDGILWFISPTNARRGDDTYYGYWKGLTITLVDNFADDDDLVRHEILHALRRDGKHIEQFADDCTYLVNCGYECIREQRAPRTWPPPDAPLVSPSVLQLSARVVAPTRRDSGWTTVLLTAVNPRDEGILVDLGAMVGVGFDCSFELGSCKPHSSPHMPSMPFYGRQRRVEGSTIRVPPGTYTIRAHFNGVPIAPVTFVAP